MILLRNFEIQELVCPHVYNKFGGDAWMFIDQKLIETLDIVRNKILCSPMIINNWSNGGSYTQRGLRCNICDLVKNKTSSGKVYLSAHNFGKAIDATVEGMTAQEARNLIIKNQILLPYPIRLEDGVSWLHLDVYDMNKDKVYLFKV